MAAETIDKVKNLFVYGLDDPRIDVQVLAVTEDKFVVTLSGEVADAEQADRLDKIANGIKAAKPNVISDVRFNVRPRISPEKRQDEMTDLWVLTYIRSRVTSTSATFQASSTPDNVDVLVEALNSIYSPPGKKAVQRAGVGRLLLRGTKETVLDIKRFLALIDAPWPQVQMSMWAVQVSGSPEDVSRRILRIGERVRMVRDQMQEVQRKLSQIVVKDLNLYDKHWGTLEKNLKLAGVDLPFDGPLSLNESLILLTLHPLRQEKAAELQLFAEGEWPTWQGEWNTYPMERGPTKKRRHQEVTPPRRPAFQRLNDLLAGTSQAADQEAFFDFRDALFCYKDTGNKRFDRPDAPHKLVRSGAVVDRVLKSVMDAFAADMADLFLDPLLRDIQASASGKNDDGIALVGRTRIVVTSGLEAGLAPEMASFVESSRPKPFGKELLDMAFPASETGTSTESTLTGSAKILAGLSDGQALTLAALLSAEPEPAYTKVAPGIAVNARPSVLPDGGAARLTIDARFGVESTPLDEDRTDIWRQAPPAGIKSHNVRTDASVSAFDLFDISSFSGRPLTPSRRPTSRSSADCH